MPMITERKGSSYLIAGKYEGDVVRSGEPGEISALISVIPISDQVVRIQFTKGPTTFTFRATTKETAEGIVIYIQKKVTEDYILEGIAGFLRKRPDVHGGWINQMGGFFFNISIHYYAGQIGEYYFYGKRA